MDQFNKYHANVSSNQHHYADLSDHYEPVDPDQRFTANNPCPICHGDDSLTRHVNERCYGFYSKDRQIAFCTREEYAGELDEAGDSGAYPHRLRGDCGCGEQHNITPLREHSARTTPSGTPGQTRRLIWSADYEIVKPDGTLAGIHHRRDYLVTEADGSEHRDKQMSWSHHRERDKDRHGRPIVRMPLYGILNLAEARHGTPVFVTEGEKAADAAHEHGLLALGTVTGAAAIPCDASLYPLHGRNIILWPDADIPGYSHMRRIAERLVVLGAASIRWVNWHGAAPGSDAFDYFMDDAHTDETLQTLIGDREDYRAPQDGAQEDMPPEYHYHLLSDLECEEMPAPKPIIGPNILYEYSIAFLYGTSNRWKSFLAISLALSVATGTPWLEQFLVKQGIVIYVSAEGARGVGKRIRAWKRQHHVSGETALRVLPFAVPLMDHAAVTRLIMEIAAQLGEDQPVLIVIDTLARSMAGGNESASEDTSRVVDAATRINQAFGACVLFVHHTGYDESHMRGSTALYGAADTVMTVSLPNTPLEPGVVASLISTKNKDDEAFKPIPFTTERVAWDGADGEPVHSLAVVPTTRGGGWSGPPRPDSPSPKDYTHNTILAWKTLNKLMLDNPKGVPSPDWERAACKSGSMTRSTFYKSRSLLVSDGWVRVTNDLYRAAVPGQVDPLGATSDGLAWDD